MTLVLLHGFLGSSREWQPLARDLAKVARVHAPDLPGHGGALQLDEVAYTLAGAAARIAQDLPQDYVLYGYSMGGRLALHMVCSALAKPRALILESASAGLEDGREARMASDAAWAKRLESEPLNDVLRDWYQQPVFASLGQGQALEAMLASRSSGDGRELARSLRGMSVARQPSHWDDLHRIDIPVLCIAGAADPAYCKSMQRMADLCPGAEMRIVPRAGHNVHAARPDAVCEAVKTFLERV